MLEDLARMGDENTSLRFKRENEANGRTVTKESE